MLKIMKPTYRYTLFGICLLGAGLLVWRLYPLIESEGPRLLAAAVNEATPPALFILLYTFLPMVGFPISVFLILLGVKFGIATGLLIMFAVLPLHLLAAYGVVHTWLRELLLRLLKKRDLELPRIPRQHSAGFSFLFMVVPGLSYSLKNYILPLAGVPPRHFFLSGFLAQGLMGIPFVVAGNVAADKSAYLLAGIILLLAVGYGLLYWLRRQGLFLSGASLRNLFSSADDAPGSKANQESDLL
jgi:uncharacterized membrane protein YdjX (TVP38/TMEM64 family)